MKLIVHSQKKEAFRFVKKAIRGIKLKTGAISEHTYKIISTYMIPISKKWGVNPDYRAMLIEYEITIPYDEEPDYNVTD